MKPKLKIENPADGSLTDAWCLADIADLFQISEANVRVRLMRGQIPEPLVHVRGRPFWSPLQFGKNEGKGQAAMGT